MFVVVLVIAMVAMLLFHFFYCLVPSLRYFGARAGAYVLGAFTYSIVGAPPVVELLFGLAPVAGPSGRAYVVASAAVLTIAAWRPYAFVRASGGPRRTDSN